MRRMEKRLFIIFATFIIIFTSANIETDAAEESVPTTKNVEQSQDAGTQNIERKKGQVYLNEPYDNPVPILYGYEIEGDGYITPGEEFTIRFNVYNTAVVSDASNVRLDLAQKDNLIYPIYGGSNTVYLGYLKTLSYLDGEITMVASKDITEEELLVNLNIYYTDNYKTENVLPLTLALPVSTSGKLSLSSVDIPSAMYVGSNNRINVTYRNNGLSTINDVVLHIMGNGVESKDISLGSIGNGSIMSADVYVEFLNEGDSTVDMYFTYTDQSGQSQETEVSTYNLKVNVYDTTTAELSENNTMQLNTTNNVISVIAFLLSVSIVLIFFYIRKRNNNSKLIAKEDKNEIFKGFRIR